MAVCSVDGLSVLDGKTASKNDSGYVIGGYDNVKIKGFRYSDKEVAAFTFTDKKGSYASSKSEKAAENSGIIAVTCFIEKAPDYVAPSIRWPITPRRWTRNRQCQDPYNYPYQSTYSTTDSDGILRSRSSCQNSMKSRSLDDNVTSSMSLNYCSSMEIPEEPAFDMGTAFGDAKQSEVTYVDFKKGHSLGTVEIYYASRANLIKMGVPLNKKAQVSWPQGFPSKFCEPPSGWRGQ
jgi:hypothetical protein